MDYTAELKTMLAKYSYRDNQEVELSSGERSTVYVNCKRTVFSPKGQFVVGNLMLDFLRKYDAHVISGPAAGAIPIVNATLYSAYMDRYQLFGSFVRATKGADRKPDIQGVFKPNLNTIVVEDVVTDGELMHTAIDTLEAAGANIKAVITLVDRSVGKPSFKSSRYDYIYLFTIDDLRKARASMDLTPKSK
jgi:orotate phosphoribosyltransferase